jgi:hypothetical protein
MSVRERRRALTLVAALGLAAMLAIASPAAADRYEPREAGHPLRIVAYILHPVGVLIDTLIFRPAHWIGSFEPLATLFGHQHD